ncbi:type II secretion system GspH family protein [Thermodesulfovibrionales bacterium]|nr:type II secretion system GspH family protein [Thermodesulfovibrionales bacterium]MCL0042475.1 type II secretion system GspH family protein [Thermodesulfovibrionales bacterium]MCL0083375.1 type II secretion system GspH family protein [Thermodesulfovibrionales bacterium]
MKRKNAGFTFLELLIVMMILSMGFFILAPKVASWHLDKVDTVQEGLDDIISKAMAQAKRDRQAVDIFFTKGSGKVRLKGHGAAGNEIKEFELHGGVTIMQATVNDRPAEGLSFSIKAYPVGIIDYFEFVLSDGSRVVSMPLLGRVMSE